MKTIEWKVAAIREVAKDTKTIFLQPTDETFSHPPGGRVEYQAGQFLTFIFSFHGRELRRSYSFSSTPGIDPLPAITIKRVTNGEVSRFLLDHLQPGDKLISLPPAGKFILEKGPRLLVFIAAGSGLVPVFSLIKASFSQQPDTQIVLISQHRDTESILFETSFREMEKLYANQFQWINLLSNPASPARVARLNNFLLEELVKSFIHTGPSSSHTGPSSSFYLCGPPAFMRMALFTLRSLGVRDERIKKENFTVEYVPPPPLLSDTRPKKVTVLASESRYEFQVTWPSTILQGALDHHIPLPYSCRGGRCSSCVARCTKGRVKMSINEVLTDPDLQAGLVLTCVGYAETDIELNFNT